MEQNKYIPGDWVKYARVYPIRYVQIEQVRENILFLKSRYVVDYSDVEPIPLTSEILEKNGWEKDDRGYYKSCIFLNKDGFGGWAVGLGEEYIRTIIFVHQFQHLLFGLGIDFDFNLVNNYENHYRCYGKTIHL